jgi:hypothetical protein
LAGMSPRGGCVGFFNNLAKVGASADNTTNFFWKRPERRW